ncbi:uncharacterized protein [Nicotiana sylvestris]|uniref:uncharacterized protein n=1 Tax=Nicotiana sylvestris TaxID=4096 RepID=UPI00388C89FB
MGHSPPLPSYSEEAIKEAQSLQVPNPSRVLGGEDPFRDCFTGVDAAADLNDASTLLEEAQRLLSWAIIKFRAELSQCEAELKKYLDEEKALKLLCSQKKEELKDLQTELAKARKNEAELDEQLQQKLEMIGKLRIKVDRVKSDCHRWKDNMDRLAVDKKASLAQLASAEAQLRGKKMKNLAQAKKIKELEESLAKVGAEVAEAKAEVEKTKATTDKTIAVHLRDAEAVQAELREASNRKK